MRRHRRQRLAQVRAAHDRARIHLREHGLAPTPLADFHAGTPTRSALLMNFTNVASSAQAEELARRVAQALDGAMP